MESKEPNVQVTLVHDKAKCPATQKMGDVGYDLFACHDVIIPARDQKLVDTGVQMAIPVGIYGRVASRSGVAVKSKLHVGAGVIDNNYRGNIKILLLNFSDKDVEIKTYDRIAQMVFERVALPQIQIVQTLDETNRGQNGFGSSGR